MLGTVLMSRKTSRPFYDFIVEKNTESDKSIIKLKKLNNEEKLKEIARMLSGKEITLEAVNAARKLINH